MPCTKFVREIYQRQFRVRSFGGAAAPPYQRRRRAIFAGPETKLKSLTRLAALSLRRSGWAMDTLGAASFFENSPVIYGWVVRVRSPQVPSGTADDLVHHPQTSFVPDGTFYFRTSFNPALKGWAIVRSPPATRSWLISGVAPRPFNPRQFVKFVSKLGGSPHPAAPPSPHLIRLHPISAR